MTVGHKILSVAPRPAVDAPGADPETMETWS